MSNAGPPGCAGATPGLRARAGAGAWAGVSRRILLASGAGGAAVWLTRGATPARAEEPAGPLSARQVELMLKTLSAAPSHGFGREEFASADLAQRVSSGDPDARGELRAAILAYARAQHGQRLPASAFPAEWAVRPAPYDPAPELATAVAQDQLGAWLDGLPPAYEGYNGLRASLATYRVLAASHGWQTIPDGAPLSTGMDDPRVVAVRRRIVAETPDALDDDASSTFDAALVQAVIAFQHRYGLVPDGVVGPPTIAAMNATVGERILQIKANMERWRWLPRTLPPSRIQVNIAAAVMAVYQDDRPVLAMKAVAGRPDDATPMLQSTVESIVLNPPWHVPVSIADKEIWPKARHDKGYLARHAYTVRKADDGTMHIIQKAGPKSALGRFKFDFANPFGVYLHDTPVQAGFSHTSRLASHGCVRLEHPKALADLLLTGDQDWPPERVDHVVATDDTVRAPLPRPMPVFILYWTAFVDNAGQTEFRADGYDWDRKLLNLIAAQAQHA